MYVNWKIKQISKIQAQNEVSYFFSQFFLCFIDFKQIFIRQKKCNRQNSLSRSSFSYMNFVDYLRPAIQNDSPAPSPRKMQILLILVKNSSEIEIKLSPFCMKTRVSLKYFVTDCRSTNQSCSCGRTFKQLAQYIVSN